MTTTKGHCSCHAIEYEFEGKPKWVAHCHCESCRRAVSSPIATYIGVEIDQFRYLQGMPTVHESSPGVTRYFCGTCGSPMAYTSNRWPGQVHLHQGTLVDPNQWPPSVHVNVAEQIDWFEVSDHLPRHEKFGGKDEKPARKGPRRT